IEVKNQSPKNVYIQKIELNGKTYSSFNLDHQAIVNGGKIVFYMSNKPKK
ncbi:MAG: glycoside hydrolase family 92 protein, partial [Algoriella sp.]|nr:glycoside hydrolase family 92 protein [Algoriella sp.]